MYTGCLAIALSPNEKWERLRITLETNQERKLRNGLTLNDRVPIVTIPLEMIDAFVPMLLCSITIEEPFLKSRISNDGNRLLLVVRTRLFGSCNIYCQEKADTLHTYNMYIYIGWRSGRRRNFRQEFIDEFDVDLSSEILIVRIYRIKYAELR